MPARCLLLAAVAAISASSALAQPLTDGLPPFRAPGDVAPAGNPLADPPADDRPPFGGAGPAFGEELSGGGGAEPITPPVGDGAADGDSGDDGPIERTVLQPVDGYGQYSWLPEGPLPRGEWLEEIQVPANLIDCTCNGQQPGPRCRVWRSLVKPTDPTIDPRCVVCVKEPYLAYETVTEELRVVIHRCFESSEPFKHTGCEGGHCYEAKGTTTLRKLHTCEAKAPIKYQRPVVRYRDVYYYIPCGNK